MSSNFKTSHRTSASSNPTVAADTPPPFHLTKRKIFYSAAAKFLCEFLNEKIKGTLPLENYGMFCAMEEGKLFISLCLHPTSNDGATLPLAPIRDVIKSIDRVIIDEELHHSGIYEAKDSQSDAIVYTIHFDTPDEAMQFIETVGKPYDMVTNNNHLRDSWETVIENPANIFFQSNLYTLAHIRALYQDYRGFPLAPSQGNHLLH